MTDLAAELEAANETIDELRQLRDNLADGAAEAHQKADQLRARLAEVEAERDAALASLTELAPASLAAENARLRQELATVSERELSALAQLSAAEDERDKLRTDTERLSRRLAGRYEETVGLRTQIEWMLERRLEEYDHGE